MIVQVLLLHKASVRFRRSREFREATFRLTTSVQVGEAGDPEAPVALRFRPGLGADASLCPVDVRLHEGATWTSVDTGGKSVARVLGKGVDPRELEEPSADLKGIIETLSRTASPPEPGLLPSGAPVPPRGQLPVTVLADDPRVAEVAWDDADVRRAALAEAAQGFLVVEGVLWRRTPSPALLVLPRADGFSATVSFSASGVPERFPAHMAFPADRADLAREAAAMSTAEGAYLVDQSEWLDEVLPFPRDQGLEGRAVASAAKALRDAMTGEIHRRDEGYFAAYRRLRDAVSDDGPDDAALAEALAQAFEAETAAAGDRADKAASSAARMASAVALMRVAAERDDVLAAAFR